MEWETIDKILDWSLAIIIIAVATYVFIKGEWWKS